MPPSTIIPTACAACGEPLTAAMATGHVARQVFDLPEPRPLIVTEHRAHGCRCAACGTQTRAAFPDGVTAPVQYGTRIGAFVLYLLHYQLLPEKRLAALMADLFGVQAGHRDHRPDQPGLCPALPGVRRCRARPRGRGTGQAHGRNRLPDRRQDAVAAYRLDHLAHLLPRLSRSAAACWRMSPALSCMTTGSRTTR